jgi:hypothetical protein
MQLLQNICTSSVIAFSIMGGAAAGARGDVLELANGGRIEGRLVESGNDKKDPYVVELSGGGRMTIPRSQVTRVNATSDAEAEYEKQARTSPDTVEAHWRLAEWCREHKLREASQKHLARVLELDPNHEKARSILGFRKNEGQWMTRDDVMESRGMVMYEGKYVTRQHVELLERQKEAKGSQADWANNIERLRRWLTGRRQDRSAQALAEIQSIRDPQAAEAVVAALRREEDPDLKRLWMEVTARLDHPAAVDALVELSLLDADPEVRIQSLEYLVKSGRKGLLTPYVRALSDRDNEVVNRAGAALGQIGDTDAIGPLIGALVTKHKFKVAEGSSDQHAYNFSAGGGGAFSFGGGGPKVVTQAMQNPSVLASLQSLSGANFDYDQNQWRGWLAAQAKRQAVDVRRDQ